VAWRVTVRRGPVTLEAAGGTVSELLGALAAVPGRLCVARRGITQHRLSNCRIAVLALFLPLS